MSNVLFASFKKIQNSCSSICGNGKKYFNSASVKICFLVVILFHVLFGPEAFTLGVAAFNIPATGIEIFVPRKRSDDIAVSLSNQSPSLFIINIGCNIPANIG